MRITEKLRQAGLFALMITGTTLRRGEHGPSTVTSYTPVIKLFCLSTLDVPYHHIPGTSKPHRPILVARPSGSLSAVQAGRSLIDLIDYLTSPA